MKQFTSQFTFGCVFCYAFLAESSFCLINPKKLCIYMMYKFINSEMCSLQSNLYTLTYLNPILPNIVQAKNKTFTVICLPLGTLFDLCSMFGL